MRSEWFCFQQRANLDMLLFMSPGIVLTSFTYASVDLTDGLSHMTGHHAAKL